MNGTILSKDKVKQIRKLLPPRSITEIHKQTGYSFQHVSRVLGGYEYNETIIKAAIERIKSTMELNSELDEILKQSA